MKSSVNDTKYSLCPGVRMGDGPQRSLCTSLPNFSCRGGSRTLPIGLCVAFAYLHESHLSIVVLEGSNVIPVMTPSLIIRLMLSGATCPSLAWISHMVSCSSVFASPANSFLGPFIQYRPLFTGISPSNFFFSLKILHVSARNSAAYPAAVRRLMETNVTA